MKNFLFENIWMLSRKDRRARLVEFHQNKNLIQGGNHTGKSSIIKTLYLTLGAKPQGELEQWDENTISSVEFRIDNKKYRVIHQSGVRALFDSNNQIIISTGKYAEWSEKFAAVIGFNLVLTNKSGNSVLADPKCFFLPFYINQDGSWQSNWDTFTGLQQFKSPIGPILEYFSGIKPPEFYEAKAKKDAEQALLDNLKKESVFLNKAQERFGKKLSLSGPKIDPENFKVEVSRLTIQITELNKNQEILREQSVKERDLLTSINLQICMAQEALKSYEGDAKFLRTDSREVLICPVCNAEHKESFYDLLVYADDANSLREITVKLNGDAKTIEGSLKKTISEIASLDQQYREISRTLETRKGDMQFRQVVESLGAEQAFKAFEDERSALEQEVNLHSLEVERLVSVMNGFTDKKRAGSILKQFRAAYSWAINELNLPAGPKARVGLTSRPQKSGSGGPRSILAYYSALWDICFGKTGSFSIPIVVDSPNQQGQDTINLPKVIEFVSSKLSTTAQLILGSENDVDYSFDKKIILDKPYQLLETDSFDIASRELEPLVALMYFAANNQEK